MNKYIGLILFCLLLTQANSQLELKILDSSYVGYFSYLADIAPISDSESGHYSQSARVQKIEASNIFNYSDTLRCLDYDIYDLGNSEESLRSSGKRVRKVTICESQDSAVYIMSPSSWNIISKEQFKELRDSLRMNHPKMSTYWDTFQYIPGYINLDTSDFLSEEIHFMKVNRKPSFTEQYGEDSIMLFGGIEPHLLYDFGAKVGDTVRITYFDDNYWYQDLDTSNDSVEFILKNIYDLSVCTNELNCEGSFPAYISSIGFYYEFEKLYNLDGFLHNIDYTSHTVIGSGKYLKPWTVNRLFPENYGEYSPYCNNIDTNSLSSSCPFVPSTGVDPCAILCRRDSLISSVIESEITLEEYSIYVFPNPANDHLFISTFSSEQRQHINNVEIYGISGSQVYKRAYRGDSNIRLEVASLAPGLYILKVSYGDGHIGLKKFIKIE